MSYGSRNWEGKKDEADRHRDNQSIDLIRITSGLRNRWDFDVGTSGLSPSTWDNHEPSITLHTFQHGHAAISSRAQVRPPPQPSRIKSIDCLLGLVFTPGSVDAFCRRRAKC